MSDRRAHRLPFEVIAGVALGIVAVLLSATQADEDASPDLGPDVVILRELQDIYEPVPFDHKSHAEMAQMWYGCVTCHHRSPDPTAIEPDAEAALPTTPSAHTQAEAERIPACKSCHSVAADESNIRMPSLKGAYHRQCLNCHKEWSDANNCVVCHEPVEGRDPSSAEPTPDDVITRMHPPIDPPTVKVYQTRFTPADGDNVTFRHDEHLKRFGLTCVDCHHGDTCANCHEPAAVPGRHKVLEPARSWRQSHGPCMTCHQNQSCRHCHYRDDESPPPSFDHRTTGQALDDDHAALGCRQCHQKLDFGATMSCNTAACHDRGEPIIFPDERPGPVLAAPTPDERGADSSLPAVGVAHGPRIIPDWYRHRYGIDDTDGPDAGDEAPATPDGLETPLPVPIVVPDVEPADLPPLALRDGRPTQIVAADRCGTADCHPYIKATAYVHGPVSIDACDVCHQPLDVEAHTFRLLRDGADLCTYCHEFGVRSMPVAHKPVELGECLGCHDPHGGHDATLTREDSIPHLCGRCHDSIAWDRSMPHTPAGDGRCVSCHAPHGSMFPNLLDAIGPDLCLACHDEFDRRLGTVKIVHQALEEGCTACHDVHGSDFPMTIRQTLADACAECHEDVADGAASARFPHSIVTADRACLTCHAPHGADVAALMTEPQIDVCMECHDEDIALDDGRTIHAAADLMDPKARRHGPIRDGQCSPCHLPHGSDRAMLLAKPYDVDVSPQFTVAANALCFECHDERLAAQGLIDGVTRFRDGDLNLHYVHVARRSWVQYCPACHGPHGSQQDRNVRQSVAFGKWQIPVLFNRTATGGTCAPGCHRPFDYDREQPVGYDRQRLLLADLQEASPDSLPRAELVRATRPALQGEGTEQLTIKTWQAKDAEGRQIVVPDPQRTSILLFLRPDVPESQTTLRVLAAAMQAREPMQVVAVFSSEPTPRDLPAVSQGVGEDGAVVVDQAGALAEQLGVSAWPTLLIVRHDGVVASVGGTARALALKLDAYIDWAAGEAESITIEAQPTDAQIVSDTLPRQITWYLLTARTMLDEGNAGVAERLLRDAIKRQPDSIPLQIALIEAMISADRADEAIDQFNQLPPDAMPPERSALLQARLLVAQDQYADALDLLRGLVQDKPDLAAAHYLIGQIHEAQGNWQEAAAAFRAAHDLSPE